MFKVLTPGCDPTRGSKYSACVDLVASKDVTIGAGETKLIGLGICIDLNPMFENEKKNLLDLTLEDFENRKDIFMRSHYLELMLRSSLGKKGLILPNGVGVIDLDYKDEIKMIIHNPITEHHITFWIDRVLAMCGIQKQFNQDNSANHHIKKGDKIAQITLLEHKSYLFGIESDVVRDGGFGSTGA